MAPKLKRTSNKRSPDPASGPGQSNPTLIIGILLAVAVGVLFWVLTTQLQEKGQVMVAKGNIPAFSTITAAQLEAQTVPKDSITEGDLSKQEFDKRTSSGQGLVNRIELIAGQRVPLGAVGASSTGSLAAVKQGERVVSLNATFAGAVAGIAVAGSVVDVYSGAGAGNDGAVVVENAKVLALGAGNSAGANVRPGNKLQGEEGSSNEIVVVLAVPSEDAEKLLSLAQASLALDPRLSFTENGTICQINRCAQQDAQPLAPSAGQAVTPDQPATSPDQPAGTP